MSQPPFDPYRDRPAPPGYASYPPQAGPQRYAAPGPPAPPRSPAQQPYRRPAPPPPPESDGFRLRLPGLGLLLTLAGLVVQLLSLTLLPWVEYRANGGSSASVVDIWQAAADHGAHGFGGWYVLLFSYPLAILGVLLALAVVFDSVAMKVIWAGLALLGLGILVLRYGFGPLSELFGTEGGPDITTQELTTLVIALAAAILVIFVLKMAVSMFRRVAVLILLGLAGVHIAAVVDLVKESGTAELTFGAYGPALGYLLTAAAAMIPRRLPGV